MLQLQLCVFFICTNQIKMLQSVTSHTEIIAIIINSICDTVHSCRQKLKLNFITRWAYFCSPAHEVNYTHLYVKKSISPVSSFDKSNFQLLIFCFVHCEQWMIFLDTCLFHQYVWHLFYWILWMASSVKSQHDKALRTSLLIFRKFEMHIKGFHLFDCCIIVRSGCLL